MLCIDVSGLIQGEDDVMTILADVFMRRDCTIPLIGCFRPRARSIVEKAVSFLRFAPNLKCNSNNGDVVYEEGSVIDFYCVNGKGLDLHELACLAFCRALDLDPSLSE